MIADALRSLPAIGKAFTPAEVPHGSGDTISWRLPRETDPDRRVGDGSGTSIAGAIYNWYLRTFPEAILTVYRDEDSDRVPVRPHDLTARIEEPNDYYSGDDLFAGLIFSYIFDGNAYWLKARNQSGRVAELWWIPHSLIEPKGSKEEFIAHYEYKVSGKRYEVPPSEIVHVRHGVDPENPRKGLSPLKAQMREIMTDEEAAMFTAAMLLNGGTPGLIISPDGDGTINPEDGETIKAKVNQVTTGHNKGSTVVLSGGVVLEQFGFSPEQLALTQLRAIPEERVSAALGVAAAVVGLGTGLAQTKVGATMHELREMATEQALVPMWRKFAHQIERQLLYEFSGGDQKLTLDYDVSKVRVLQEDQQKLHERTREDLRAGGITRAQFQRRLGYPIENREVYLMGLNTLEVPAEVAPKSLSRNGHKALTETQRAGLGFVQALDRQGRAIEAAFGERLEAAFDELGRMVAEAYEALPKQTPDDERIVHALLQAISIDGFTDRTIRPLYVASYEQWVEAAVGGIRSSFGVTISIGERDLIAERVLSEGGRRVGMLDITGDTRAALFRSLEQAQVDGLGVPQTARLIREQVPAGRFTHAGAQYRARLIARTEMLYARNIAVAETSRAAGFERFVAFDNRTGFDDDECMARDGEEFTYDEMIAEDDHPNATLSWSPIPRTS